MWCIKRRVEPYVDDSQPNNVNSAVLSGSEFVEPSPLHDFVFQEIECDGNKSIRVTSMQYRQHLELTVISELEARTRVPVHATDFQ